MDKNKGIMDLRAELQKLDDKQLAYVLARSKTTSVNQACKDCDISSSTFYSWDNREELETLANLMKVDRAVEVEMRLRDTLPEAVQVIIKGLRERKYNDQFRSAVEILDRTMGKATQKIDQKTEHSGKVDVIHVSWDEAVGDGDDTD